MNCDNFWKSCITYGNNSCQIIKAQCYKITHGWKIPIQSAKWTKDVQVTEHKTLDDMVLDSTGQMTPKKWSLTEFWCTIKEEYPQLPENAIKKFLPFQLRICVRSDFPHLLQPK